MSGGHTVEIGGREIELSNLDKVLFPDDGLTKGDLVDYYRRVAETMLPHLEDRPLSMHRFPDGLGGEDFFQKNAGDYFPEWIRIEEVAKEGGTVRHVVCDDVATLVYLANQATITPHVWLSRTDRQHAPDRMIFDLDPSDGDPAPVRSAARRVRDALTELDLPAHVMTTGSRGFHVWVPLGRREEFGTVRAFARDLARVLATRHPERLTIEQRKKKRGDRVFLDYLRNSYAQTTVAPYSVRARPGAPVATPIEWSELDGLEPRRYTVANLFQRLGQKDDPWAELGREAGSVTPVRHRLDEWLGELGLEAEA